MKRLLIPVLLILLLALQGVATEIAVSFSSMQQVYVIAHWVFIFIVCISILYDSDDSYYALVYSILFGLLIDIVYTDMLGIYMLGYGLSMFLLQGLRRALYPNIYSTILMVTVGIIVADSFINFIYSMVGIIDIGILEYIWIRLLPTLLANIIFLFILYPFVHKLLPRWRKDLDEGN